MRAVSFGGAVLLTHWLSAFPLQAQEAAASRAVERSVPSLPQSCYFVVPPREPAPTVVLAGELWLDDVVRKDSK